MKTVILESFTDEMTGELGYGVKGLDTSDDRINSTYDPVLIAHDLIEHVNGVKNIGSIEDELQALGAVWYVRGQWGDLRRDNVGSAYTPYESLAFDVARMFRDWYQGDMEHISSPVTQPHDFDDDFKAILNIAESTYKDEFNEEDITPELHEHWPQYRWSALAHMRKGARKAARKYGTALVANSMFWDIASALEPYLKSVDYEGQQLKLRYGREGAYCEEYYA